MSKKESHETKEREELKARIAELEGKVKAGEEAALKRICTALDIDEDSLKLKDVVQREPEPIIRCYVPTPVRVNHLVFHGNCEMAQSTFYVVQQALGDRRTRLMKEMTGNTTILEELIGGHGFAPHVVQKVNMNGERIA